MRSLQMVDEDTSHINKSMTAERALEVGSDRMEKFLYADDNVYKWVEVNGKYLGPDNKKMMIDILNDRHKRLIEAIDRGGVKRFAGFKTG